MNSYSIQSTALNKSNVFIAFRQALMTGSSPLVEFVETNPALFSDIFNILIN